NTIAKISKYYIREIPTIFTVGQTFPQLLVPRPQSRRVTQLAKSRLKITALRMMHKSRHKRLRFERLMRLLPGNSDAQIRQRLKEFAEFQRKGDSSGWWHIKPGMDIPESELRKLATPEDVCLHESALVGAQRLRDAGYGDLVAKEEKEIEDEEDSGGDIEVLLAPWTVTKNYSNAVIGK
ncbi:hypothetical protein HK096_001851, partial [Nowakowskiella sp. JEL0078]